MTAEQKPEESIHMLEAEIFGSSDLSGEKETTDNRISDAKATLTYAMLERLSKHIIELTRKSFDQGECYKFVLLLRKTDSPEEFEGPGRPCFRTRLFVYSRIHTGICEMKRLIITRYVRYFTRRIYGRHKQNHMEDHLPIV